MSDEKPLIHYIGLASWQQTAWYTLARTVKLSRLILQRDLKVKQTKNKYNVLHVNFIYLYQIIMNHNCFYIYKSQKCWLLSAYCQNSKHFKMFPISINIIFNKHEHTH